MEDTTEGHIDPERREEIVLPESEDWYRDFGGES